MTDPHTAQERDSLRRWVETWRKAGEELDAIRRREIETTDTAQAVHDLFGCSQTWPELPPRLTSGLVEQQAWFAKLRR